MIASELRIGNLICSYSTDVVFKVGKISKNKVNGHLLFDHIQPIQLTEEWLERFGFTLINKVDYESNCGTLELESTDAGFLFDSRLVIKHVQQLQYLYFALTGEELTLKQKQQ